MTIRVLKDKKLFALEGNNTQYVFALDDKGLLRHVFWGNKVEKIEDFDILPIQDISSNDSYMDITPEEYVQYGGLRYKEKCIKVVFKDGTRDLKLIYEGFKIENGTLIIIFRDEKYPLKVYLKYNMLEEIDILNRYVEIENCGKEDITIERIFSAQYNFPGNEYYFTNVSGTWAAENNIFKQKLNGGRLVIQSSKGNTGHNNSPYFIIDKNANEFNGEVYFGVLENSGNFKIISEVTPYNTTSVSIGINDFDFKYILKPKEIFKTPKVYSGYTSKGYSDMSNRLNKLSRQYIMPLKNRNKMMPVLYNSWEATYFDVNCNNQIKLAELASAIGVELFVIDDGWFGNRNSDSSGLGDWYVNKQKFPKGLKPLIEKVNLLGMDFGIWIEPEMVNPKSILYKKHPDWVYKFNNRECTQARNQLVLNLTNNEVVEYIFNILDDLLKKNNIKYIKWDMNRPLSETGALNLEVEEQKTVWIKHTNAVCNIVEKLRQKYDQVIFEACASGGARVDYGMLKYFDEYWPSDNTDALDRLYIQEGYSYIYPIKAMRTWVTDCPNFLTNRMLSLEFRFDSAMMGILGIGGDIKKWSAQELKLAFNKIQQYKSIRHIIQNGDIYRINSLADGNICTVEYNLNKKECIVFIFNTISKFNKKNYNIKIKELIKNANYYIELDGKKFQKSGEYLVNVGISTSFKNDFDSKIIKITLNNI